VRLQAAAARCSLAAVPAPARLALQALLPLLLLLAVEQAAAVASAPHQLLLQQQTYEEF
jgi:hypothetical protein